MLSRVKKRHIALLGLLILSAVLIVCYFQNDQQRNIGDIRPYQAEKDFKLLVQLMNENKFWITERANFFPERTLLTRAPTDEPEKKGLVSIDVLAVDEKPAGFIAYYPRSKVHGFVWMLAVGKNFRGQGFGKRLLTNAILQLKNRGATYVTMMTRLINKPALSLYKKVGFVEEDRDEERGVIFLIKRNL